MPVFLTMFLILGDPSGFLNGSWRDLLAVASVSATVIGFAIAIWRIMRVGSSAQEASRAAQAARQDVSRNLRLAELGSAVTLINEIHALLRSGQLDATALRLNDFRELWVQLRAAGQHSKAEEREFQSSVVQVASFQAALFRQHHGSGKPADPAHIHVKLTEISTFLQE